MIDHWNPAVAAWIKQQYDRLVSDEHPSDPYRQKAAAKAVGVPVYGDLGGYLVITLDGEIVYCDDEGDLVVEVTDPIWRRIALVSAAGVDNTLRQLLPTRPSGADECRACHRSGKIYPRVFCSACGGMGWQ